MICNNSHGIVFQRRFNSFWRKTILQLNWMKRKNHFGHKLSKNGQQFNWTTLKVWGKKEFSKMKYLLNGDFSIRRSSIHRFIAIIWRKTHKCPVSYVPSPAPQIQVLNSKTIGSSMANKVTDLPKLSHRIVIHHTYL